MKEIEKEIQGFQGYTISNFGVFRKNGVIVEGYVKKFNGNYIQVSLRNPGGNRWTPFIHTLVLLYFVGPRKDNQLARHLDGNPLNNRLDNLVWGSPQENSDDTIRHGRTRFGTKNSNAVLTDEDVLEIRRRISVGETAEEVAKDYPVTPSAVRNAARGGRWKHLPRALGNRKPGPKKFGKVAESG